MKIVVLDGYTENPGDLCWDGISKLGDLTVYDRTSFTDPREAISRIGDAQIVITNKTPITKEILDACPSIRYISVLATGYNIVDVAAARAKNIPVSNIPTYGTDSVAQFTIAMLLELCHHIGHHSNEVHNGRWESCLDFCFWDTPLIELSGKTLGIIGAGRIGKRVGEIAHSFGMNVIAYSRSSACGTVDGCISCASFDEVISKSDVISLHCSLTSDTKGIINRDSISKMKDGVILLNSSRGPLVVEQDLYDALESGKVAGCAVDVASVEPIKSDNLLLKAKNCIITPHIAWATKEARIRIMDGTAENLKAFMNNAPINVVN